MKISSGKAQTLMVQISSETDAADWIERNLRLTTTSAAKSILPFATIKFDVRGSWTLDFKGNLTLCDILHTLQGGLVSKDGSWRI